MELAAMLAPAGDEGERVVRLPQDLHRGDRSPRSDFAVFEQIHSRSAAVSPGIASTCPTCLASPLGAMSNGLSVPMTMWFAPATVMRWRVERGSCVRQSK